jgi:hypothetical protein
LSFSSAQAVKKQSLFATFKKCVAYVIAAAEDARPLSFGKSKRMTALFEMLDPLWNVPCRATANRVALALKEYSEEMFRVLLLKLKPEPVPAKTLILFLATQKDQFGSY